MEKAVRLLTKHPSEEIRFPKVPSLQEPIFVSGKLQPSENIPGFT